MASIDLEFRFVAKFCGLVLAGDDSVDAVAAGLTPEMLEDARLREAFRFLADRHAAGETEDKIALETDLCRTVGEQLGGEILDGAPLAVGFGIRPDAAMVLRHWQARNATQYLADLSESAREKLTTDPKAAIEQLEEGAIRAHGILLETGVTKAPRSRAEIAKAEIAIVTEPKRYVLRASWPYPKMRRALGDLLPGRMVGITAFPNAGKSTFAANLFYGFLRQNVPAIAVVTEMGDDWLRRAWAAEARVPQDVAENRLWDQSDPEVRQFLGSRWEAIDFEVENQMRHHRESYLRVIEDFPSLPCEVVEQSPITPEQVIARLRILRRRYPGQFVVAFIDHMHNLKYPDDEVDKHVGIAAARLREFCRADGAMAIVALFQPKKPESKTSAEYRPIYARDIRGQVAQVLDVHLSIYRQHVLTTRERTPWGSFKADIDPATGKPKWCKEQEARELAADGEPAGKLDDERMYLKPDKRRIGGEGSTFILDFEADTGRVSETDTRRYLAAI